MKKYLAAAPGTKAPDLGGREIDLTSLAGREIKKTRVLPDGRIVLLIDQGYGRRGLSVVVTAGLYRRITLVQEPGGDAPA